tara:strand:+ start:383 stop:1402 length:1020 start_codon:yes stop_codon:yes gene_type:complete
MKKHLTDIVRKYGQEDKSKYEFVLSQNERNFSLPTSLFDKFKESIDEKDLFFYPNTKKLKEKIADYNRVSAENILLTPGSDIGIKTIFETFDVKDKNVITTNFHFSMYDVYSNLYQTELKKARYNNTTFNVRNLLDKINKDTQFIIIANPNSPVGDYYNFNKIEKLLETGVYVVIDEAYQEFIPQESFSCKVNKYKNLIVLKTFSKAFGAAGCRVGYTVSHPDNIELLSKFRFMYEVSSIGMKYAEFILDNIEYYERYIRKTMQMKEKTVKLLSVKPFKLINTSSSWFFIEHSSTIQKIFEDNKASYRVCSLPVKGKYIKFNYDLSLNDSKLIKDLLNV